MDSTRYARASSPFESGFGLEQYIRPRLRPSTRALMTFARGRLATLSVTGPPSALSGWSHDGLTCFHQRLRSSNPGGLYLLSDSASNRRLRPTSSRSCLRRRWSILDPLGEQRPCDPSVLGG